MYDFVKIKDTIETFGLVEKVCNKEAQEELEEIFYNSIDAEFNDDFEKVFGTSVEDKKKILCGDVLEAYKKDEKNIRDYLEVSYNLLMRLVKVADNSIQEKSGKAIIDDIDLMKEIMVAFVVKEKFWTTNTYINATVQEMGKLFIWVRNELLRNN